MLASLAGGITSFLLGYLFYGIIFHSDFQMNYISPEGFLATTPKLLPIFLGNLFVGITFTFIYYKWTNISRFKTGLINGAIIGGLLALADNLVIFGRTSNFSLSGILLDALILAIMSGITGGVVAVVLGLLNKTEE